MSLKKAFERVLKSRNNQKNEPVDVSKIDPNVYRAVVEHYTSSPEFDNELNNYLDEITNKAYQDHVKQTPTEYTPKMEEPKEMESLKSLLDRIDLENSQYIENKINEIKKKGEAK